MFSHVAITVTYSAVVPGERTVVAIPRSSVRTVVSERFTWVEFVANVTTPLETGLPSRSTLTVITAISAEFAVIMVALACTETIPTAIVTGVDWVRVPHSAVIVVVPVVVPGVKVTVASPWASVMAVAEERVPRIGVAEKVTVSPTSGFPFRATCAVIVEVMVEPAAKVDGSAETEKEPAEETKESTEPVEDTTGIDLETQPEPEQEVTDTEPSEQPEDIDLSSEPASTMEDEKEIIELNLITEENPGLITEPGQTPEQPTQPPQEPTGPQTELQKVPCPICQHMIVIYSDSCPHCCTDMTWQ